MNTHAQMLKKALDDPSGDYKASNFSYISSAFGRQVDNRFFLVGIFYSYTTAVAHVVHNKLDDRLEVHALSRWGSPTTDRQLRRLRCAVEAHDKHDLYLVPKLQGYPNYRTDMAYISEAYAYVRSKLRHMAKTSFAFKSYTNRFDILINHLSETIHLVTDKVPAESYSNYFTPEQFSQLSKVFQQKAFMETLLENSGGDGRTIKTALCGWMALEGSHE